MPDSTTYRVVLALETTGSLGAKVGEITEKIGRAHVATGHFQHAAAMMGEVVGRSFERVGHLLESVADKIMHVAEAGAALGAAGAFGVAAYGVTHLNRELEETKISLGAIFQAQGFAGDFTNAFSLAGDQLTKMKQDVKTLPGDLGQLSDIMKMIATPAAQGGLGADAIRKLAGQTMLVGTILGVQQDVAAREMANLLAGRAGAHNILGGRLGLIGEQARTFNAESPTKRVEEIQQLLSRYQGANDRFAQSFIANWTTLKDNIKYGFLADATAPLFEAVKRTMATINTWFDHNQDKIKSWSSVIGNRLASMWEDMTAAAKKFGPALENIGNRFFDLWTGAINKARELEPVLAKVASVLEHVSGADITSAARAVLEMKLAGMGLQAAGGVLGAAGTGIRIAGAMGAFSGEGAAAGAGVGAIGAVALPVAIVSIGAAAVATMAAFGEAHALADPASPYHKDALIAAKDLAKGVTDMKTAAEPAIGMFDKLGVALTDFAGVIMQGLAAFTQGYHALPHRGGYVDRPPDRSEYLPQDAGLGSEAGVGLARFGEGGGKFWENVGGAIATGAKKLPGGGGGTNIQKVEVIVKGSDDPSRVARLVVSELQKVARNPTRSANVPDYSAMR